ncbi:hypothetical protein ABPG72_016976 [Tetrahymena utriculariae]
MMLQLTKNNEITFYQLINQQINTQQQQQKQQSYIIYLKQSKKPIRTAKKSDNFQCFDKRELLLTQNHQFRKSQSQNLKIKTFLLKCYLTQINSKQQIITLIKQTNNIQTNQTNQQKA